MAKLSSYEQAEEERKKNSSIEFRFGEKDKLQPAGFGNLGPDKPVTVIIKGKTKSFSSGDEWDKSKRLSVDPESIEIITQAETSEVSMDAAIKAANSTRKKV
jgi:hypothetical protein